MARRPTLKAALPVLAISLALRVGWATCPHVTPVRDFRDYDKRALSWLDADKLGWGGSQARRTPVYRGFLAAVYAVSGRAQRSALIAQGVLGALPPHPRLLPSRRAPEERPVGDRKLGPTLIATGT